MPELDPCPPHAGLPWAGRAAYVRSVPSLGLPGHPVTLLSLLRACRRPPPATHALAGSRGVRLSDSGCRGGHQVLTGLGFASLLSAEAGTQPGKAGGSFPLRGLILGDRPVPQSVGSHAVPPRRPLACEGPQWDPTRPRPSTRSVLGRSCCTHVPFCHLLCVVTPRCFSSGTRTCQAWSTFQWCR